jgi:DNA polymerase sigma
MAKLHEDLVAALPEGETPPPGGFFEVVLCRDHCVLATEVGATREGGKPWDTVKPLARYFQDLTQVILVDDSPHKSLPEEAANMLVMPVWAGPETESGVNDAALPALIDGLMDALEAVKEGDRIDDIRPLVGEITNTLMILFPPPPPLPTDGEAEEGAAGVFEDAGAAVTMNGLSLNKSGNATPQPPGLPPPPHLLRSATRAAPPAASIGAEAINHHAALFFLVLVKLKDLPAIPGASLFDINTLLQRRSMVAYKTIFKSSAKAAVKNLVDTGILKIIENTTTSGNDQRGTRYALNPQIKQSLLTSERLIEIEKYAQTLPPATTTNNSTKKKRNKGRKQPVKSAEEAAPPPGEVDTNNDTTTSTTEAEMMKDLVLSTIAELETRPGVSKESLDLAISTLFTPIPALQGWFGSHVGQNIHRKVQDALRRVIQDALDAWCSSGDVEMVGMRGGGTPPSLFHIQITPEKGVKTVENAVFDMEKLINDAAQDVTIVLDQRRVAFVAVAEKKVEKEKVKVLPVFEDRGTLTARAVPMEKGKACAEEQEGEEKQRKKQSKQPKIAGAAAAAGNIEKSTTAAAEGNESTLTRGQQKLAAMRDKLGLPQDCGLTKAQLKELVKEANREKQRLRDEEIQKAKEARQRGAALMAPLPTHQINTTTTNNNIEDASGAVSGAGAGGTGANGGSNKGNNISQQQRTPLHVEISELARQATPTQSEIATVQAAVHAVDTAARAVWPAARAVLFGSQATGLALPGGDLDIVVLGVGPQLQRAATGFTAGQRRVLSEHLEDLLDALRRGGALLSSVQIIDAKIPIIKCLIQTSRAGPALPADISFGAANGAAAVKFLRRQILAVPPLRPLSLVVKAFLRDRGLNEVFTGGIGSYAVVNMVLAHLQREGFKADLTLADKAGLSRSSLLNNNTTTASLVKKVIVVDGKVVVHTEEKQGHSDGGGAGGDASVVVHDDQETFTYLAKLAAESSLTTTSNNSTTATTGDYDLGMLLWGFLERFSREFDFLRQAISIRQGGFVKKGKWKQARRPWLLAVEDPQEPGKDICSGSFNINYVRDEFAAAGQMLAEVSEDAEANSLAVAGSGGRGSSKNNHNGSVTDTLPMLSLLMDVECAVGRTPAANAARRALEHRAEEARQVVKSRFQTSNSQKRPGSGEFGGGGGDSRRNKRQKGMNTAADPFNFDPPPPFGYPITNHAGYTQQHTQPQRPPQRQSQEKHTPKGSSGRGSQPRGSKGSRAVEAQWKDTRGQFLEYGNDGPDYRGGGFSGEQESMQLQKYKGGRFSKKKRNTTNSEQEPQPQQKKKKGIKRKPKAGGPGAGGSGGKPKPADLGPKKKKMKKRPKKKAAAAGASGGSGKKQKGKKSSQ